jgi:hypothetical protein
MTPRRCSNCAASVYSNVYSAFCSDSGFDARLFFVDGSGNRRSRSGKTLVGARKSSCPCRLAPTGPLTPQVVLEQGPSERFLIVPANIYCDARLLAALCRKDSSAALVDGNPPEFARPLIRNPCGPALVTKDFLSAFPAVPFFEQLKEKIGNRKIDIVDAAEQDDYIVSMRRRVRPFCFPAPAEQNRR